MCGLSNLVFLVVLCCLLLNFLFCFVLFFSFQGFVCSKLYDSNPVKEFSMLLSSLMDWVKVIIKICKLNRDWVFGDTGQARPKVKPQIDDKADISRMFVYWNTVFLNFPPRFLGGSVST